MNEQNDKVFDLYKPLRNKIRNHNLIEALFLVWSYSRNYTFNYSIPPEVELPNGFSQSMDINYRRLNGVNEFELEFLTREFILHCHTRKDEKSILKKAYFGKIINYLRSDLDNGLHEIFDRGNILLDSHRWSHRQFKWQIGYNKTDMLRYHKIFSDPKVDALITKKTGLSVNEIHLVGFYTFSISANVFRDKYPIISNSTAVSQVMFDKFFSLFSMTIEEAQKSIKETYRMDETILYSFNPLTAKPILIYKNTFICPLHLLLFWQITNGLYYFICKEPKFNSVFGDSFEKYIGEVLTDVVNNPSFNIYKEQIYGKQVKKSSDWIIADGSSIIFIECKSKRMTLASKSELEVDNGLNNDIEKMATFIVQVYKTYLDYKSNKYPEIPFNSNLLFIPIIVTLETWFINYNLILPQMVRSLVQKKLEDLNIDVEIMIKHPYQILSCEEFESDIQIINKIGGRKFAELHQNKQIKTFKDDFQYEEIFKGHFDSTFIKPLEKLKDSN